MKKTPVEEMVARHEGYRSKPYRCTAGKLTVGYGYNLDAGMPEDEAHLLLRFRIGKITTELSKKISWFADLNDARQAALTDMAYQLGVAGLLKFPKAMNAMRSGDYAAAAKKMLDSKWAKSDTPERAKEISEIIRTGVIK